MARDQTKRRKKRYQATSAYAGDVKPAGIFSVFGDVRFIRAVFLIMALALVAGSFGAVLFGGVFFGRSNSANLPDFVLPDDRQTPDDSATAVPTLPAIEVRQYPEAPAMTIDPNKTYIATIKTSAGDIQVELFASQAPQTVNNFIFLARDGFYDGLAFSYADPRFSANAGDPACTAATIETCRGDGGPGYDLEENVQGEFQAGVLGMANASQFFIALTNSTQFQGYPPLGQITSGLDVAERLTKGATIQTIEIQEQ
jgi:cyclophilin family peptidyl-prolyl cis-trans isomerase